MIRFIRTKLLIQFLNICTFRNDVIPAEELIYLRLSLFRPSSVFMYRVFFVLTFSHYAVVVSLPIPLISCMLGPAESHHI